MKLSINGIKEQEAWKKAGITLPSYDVEAVSEKAKENPVWVHFGIGNIFRVFIGGMCGAWSEKLCKGRLRSVPFSGYSAYLQRYSLRNECENGIYNTVLSVRLAIGGRYPYRKPIAERIYTESVCKLDMSSHCYSVLSDTWYFGGSMACEK